MATRCYFGDNAGGGLRYGAGVNPIALDATWTPGLFASQRKRLLHSKELTLGSSATSGLQGTGINPSNFCHSQYVSVPMEAQTIAGTVKGIVSAWETNPTDNYMPQLVIRVVSYNGQVVRGTLLAANDSAISNEFDTTIDRNRKFPRNWSGAGTALSSVTVVAADRLVIEIGWRQESTSTAFGFIGDGVDWGTTPDCPERAENETDALYSISWIEFSQDIRWYPTLAGRRPGTRH